MRAVSDDLSIPSPAAYRPPQRARGLSPDTKRRMMIAGGILGAVILVGGTATLLGRSTGEVPVILADPRPVKVKPDNPGGMQIAGLNNEIFGDGDTTDGARLAPAAEAPNPAALRAPPEPRVSARAEAPRPEITEPAPRAEPSAPQATKPAPRVAPDPTHAVAAPPGSGTLVASKPTAAATAQRTATPEPVKPAATQMRPTTGGRVSVQLAAVQSQGAAEAAWVSLQRRLPDLLGGRQAVFPRTERDGKTFWRVRTSGFSDISEAKGFCQRVRAKGAACAVAEF